MPWTFTTRELLDGIERELVLRRVVYPKRVEQRKMTPQAAQREIALMEAIAEKLRREIDAGHA